MSVAPAAGRWRSTSRRRSTALEWQGALAVNFEHALRRLALIIGAETATGTSRGDDQSKQTMIFADDVPEHSTPGLCGFTGVICTN
jgi:hypothetical protein